MALPREYQDEDGLAVIEIHPEGTVTFSLHPFLAPDTTVWDFDEWKHVGRLVMKIALTPGLAHRGEVCDLLAENHVSPQMIDVYVQALYHEGIVIQP